MTHAILGNCIGHTFKQSYVIGETISFTEYSLVSGLVSPIKDLYIDSSECIMGKAVGLGCGLGLGLGLG